MPFCTNCGNQIAEGASVCLQCGAAAPGARAASFAGQRRTEGSAVASLVLGIVGIVVCPVLIPSILAIVFGNQAQSRIRSDPSLEGEGMAKAGIILGWIFVGLFGLGVVFWFFGLVLAMGT